MTYNLKYFKQKFTILYNKRPYNIARGVLIIKAVVVAMIDDVTLLETEHIMFTFH